MSEIHLQHCQCTTCRPCSGTSSDHCMGQAAAPGLAERANCLMQCTGCQQPLTGSAVTWGSAPAASQTWQAGVQQPTHPLWDSTSLQLRAAILKPRLVNSCCSLPTSPAAEANCLENVSGQETLELLTAICCAGGQKHTLTHMHTVPRSHQALLCRLACNQLDERTGCRRGISN